MESLGYLMSVLCTHTFCVLIGIKKIPRIILQRNHIFVVSCHLCISLFNPEDLLVQRNICSVLCWCLYMKNILNVTLAYCKSFAVYDNDDVVSREFGSKRHGTKYGEKDDIEGHD